MKLRFRLPQSFTRQGLSAKADDMAAAMLTQTADRIEAGGDPDEPFAPLAMPRANGSTGTPLNTNGFLGSFSRFKTDRSFGVLTAHAGAKRLLLGSTGKGGTLPPIVPKKGGALSWISGGVRRFARKIEHPPRKYIRLTAETAKQFARILAGK